jgi:hypothetical protein
MGLFERLSQALNPQVDEPRDVERAQRIAAAVLLLEMAHADHRHDDADRATSRLMRPKPMNLSPTPRRGQNSRYRSTNT